ncbi:hypothetical protein CLV30_106157 [Haloactinopolyspora alba]|uniref:Uncharacterized protein n=1 Tax=Haloactinopolyspora alba TaxID=648780 RepID=A0A2P8E3V3_9ACTN|nr:hypothetical protein [Haloactinopolyspora alba]PSL04152.1 hypothetical protein CLV30_106157 [Haloactinopolyspora alba]
MVQITNFAGGTSYFKPADESEAVAILIEPLSYERQRPTDYGPKDTAVARMTFFKSEVALETGVPDEVRESVTVQQTALARNLEQYVGKGVIVTLGQGKAKPGMNPPWIWVPASPEVQAKVVEYVKGLEEELAGAPI